MPRDVVAFWAGPGFHIVHYPLRRGALFNIVAVFRPSTHFERGDVAAIAPNWSIPIATRIPRCGRCSRRSISAGGGRSVIAIRSGIGTRAAWSCWAMPRIRPCNRWRKAPAWRLRMGCASPIASAANGNPQGAFRQYETARLLRTARVTLESRSIWDFYHSDGIDRDVLRQMYRERTEADTFRCLAWLDDGFALPEKAGRNPSAVRT